MWCIVGYSLIGEKMGSCRESRSKGSKRELYIRARKEEKRKNYKSCNWSDCPIGAIMVCRWRNGQKLKKGTKITNHSIACENFSLYIE